MPQYRVTVITGSRAFDGTNSRIYLTLVGTKGSSEKTVLDKYFHDDFARGAVDSYAINAAEDLGEILMLKVEHQKFLVQDDWFCRYITVETPSGDILEFPCYRWVITDQEVVLRDGRARLLQDDKTTQLKEQRQKELETRRKSYGWREWQPGFPMSIDVNSSAELPLDAQLDINKQEDFLVNHLKSMENRRLNDFSDKFQHSWDDFDDFKQLFLTGTNTATEYMMEHWQEDFVFGYQFLNSCNPVMIRKCTQLPAKFPVTHEMVETCLERGLTLEEEVKAGNIYIADYEILENITPNHTDPATTQYLAAPICLLYRNAKNKIMPLAIQLGQSPGESNPIFVRSDSENDWRLAKIWVRSSDFHVHQVVTHLLGTHLISEVFTIAMFRQLPAVHPVYKLLMPHIRFTIAINATAREQLIGENGIFDKAIATGGGGHVELVQKSAKKFTYRSLVFPEAIKARGMESQEELPFYFYRDDGYKVWEAIKSFVEDVVHIYYSSDMVVQEDEEIQAFVKEVCCTGMQDMDHCGFPKSLKSREELIEYLTVIIFNASAQHSAVNFGQYDWFSWVPNCPSTMRKPPPTKKGVVDTLFIMESLPDRGRSCWHLGAVWALSQFQENELFLGTYPDDHFIEKPVKEAMEKFRKKLAEVTNFIKARNEGMKMPYPYLCPDRIPNSVAV